MTRFSVRLGRVGCRHYGSTGSGEDKGNPIRGPTTTRVVVSLVRGIIIVIRAAPEWSRWWKRVPRCTVCACNGPRRLLLRRAVDGAVTSLPDRQLDAAARFSDAALAVLPQQLRSQSLSAALRSFHGKFDGAARVLAVLDQPAKRVMKAMEGLYLNGARGYDTFIGGLRHALDVEITRLVPKNRGEPVPLVTARRGVLHKLKENFFNAAKAHKSRASCSELWKQRSYLFQRAHTRTSAVLLISQERLHVSAKQEVLMSCTHPRSRSCSWLPHQA